MKMTVKRMLVFFLQMLAVVGVTLFVSRLVEEKLGLGVGEIGSALMLILTALMFFDWKIGVPCLLLSLPFLMLSGPAYKDGYTGTCILLSMIGFSFWFYGVRNGWRILWKKIR